jgi:pimeloyl-ACP methyl ester carboxylesterase
MLGEAGYEAFAPDWPGHGESSKPAAGSSFNYSQQAYLDSLDAFVQAVGIKQPYALIVQVCECACGVTWFGHTNTLFWRPETCQATHSQGLARTSCLLHCH